jgi:hypothetical protein
VSWRLLDHAVVVTVNRNNIWGPALAWAVNDETRQLQVTEGARIVQRADRPTVASLRLSVSSTGYPRMSPSLVRASGPCSQQNG